MNTDIIELGGYRDNLHALTIALMLYKNNDIDASLMLLTRLKLHIRETTDIKSIIYLMPAIESHISYMNGSGERSNPKLSKKNWLKRHIKWSLQQASGYAVQIIVYVVVVTLVVEWKLTSIFN